MIEPTTVEYSRTLAGLAGIGILLGLVRYAWTRRIRSSFPLLFVLFGAMVVLLLLAFHPEIFTLIMPDTRIERIRMAVIAVTVFFMIVTFESIRWTSLKERYALLWVLPCIFTLFLTTQPNVMDWIRTAFGMGYASTMVAVVFLAVMAAVFVLSKSVSKNESNIASIAQRCAMLESRIRELEERDRK